MTCYGENHHILPKAKTLWPEYVKFKDHPWNCVRLTGRQHIIAHWILSRAIGGVMTEALIQMAACNRNKVQINSRMYEEARREASVLMSIRKKGKPNGHNGMKRSQVTKDRMSAAQLGKTHSSDTKAKISAAKVGQSLGVKMSDEFKAKMSVIAKNRTMAQETKDKLSLFFKGRPMNPDTVAKSAASRRGLVKERMTCPHCGKEGGKGAMQRWHFTNCKYKVEDIHFEF
jgi:hypothetical protein